MNKHKEKIFELRAKGYSYDQIKNKLKCSKGTIAFHLGKGQKEKSVLRQRKRRLISHPYIKKLETFTCRKYINCVLTNKSTSYKLLYEKVRGFHRASNKEFDMKNATFTVEDVINKFSESPICYLTGEKIDINKPKTYHFDHIIPSSRGGQNTIDNLGICTKEVNFSKRDMTKDEYIELCKKVLLHNGYQIIKEQADS